MLDFPAAFNLFLLLAMGHCVADFGLQSDRMAREKCRGCDQTLSWQWWLGAHGGIHAFLVAVITGIPLLGLAEWVTHVLIDFAKCRKLWGICVDQALHLVCKVAWSLAAVSLVSAPDWIR